LQSLTQPNALARADFFRNFFIMNDPLHMIYKGIALNFVTSVIIRFASDCFWLVGGNLNENLELAYEDADKWCRDHGYGLSVDEFTKSNLNVERGVYPELNCKATDIKFLLFWLALCLHICTCGLYVEFIAVCLLYRSVCSDWWF
jgi:hypothetical protein